jgi:hypothetical protein
MKTITVKWLKKQKACLEGIQWFKKQNETDAVVVLKKLLAEKQLSWANWTVARLLEHNQQVQYAIFAAEQVIGIFEKKHPNDKRPRQAIEAAKRCIENPNEENKKAAYAAAYAAYATNVAYAADAAANAADAAADAAYAAADAAYAAYAAADAATYAIKIKIIEYGIKLLEDK